MPRLALTQHLQRYLTWSTRDLPGDTVAAVLASAHDSCPRLRGYILDEQGRVRKHVTIFIDGEPIADREKLSDTVRPNQEIFVMQALSGG
jgi:sulfur-carrier protein